MFGKLGVCQALTKLRKSKNTKNVKIVQKYIKRRKNYMYSTYNFCCININEWKDYKKKKKNLNHI